MTDLRNSATTKGRAEENKQQGLSRERIEGLMEVIKRAIVYGMAFLLTFQPVLAMPGDDDEVSEHYRYLQRKLGEPDSILAQDEIFEEHAIALLKEVEQQGRGDYFLLTGTLYERGLIKGDSTTCSEQALIYYRRALEVPFTLPTSQVETLQHKIYTLERAQSHASISQPEERRKGALGSFSDDEQDDNRPGLPPDYTNTGACVKRVKTHNPSNYLLAFSSDSEPLSSDSLPAIDDIYEQSFQTQRNDLRFFLYIPFERFELFNRYYTSNHRTEVHFSYLTSEYDDNTPEQADFIRIHNIHDLLEHHTQYDARTFLRLISIQIDGMAVFKRFLRDRFATVFPIWSELAYIHHIFNMKELPEAFLSYVTKVCYPHLQSLEQVVFEMKKLEHEKADILIKQQSQLRKIYRDIFERDAINSCTEELDADELEERKFCIQTCRAPLDEALNDIESAEFLTRDYRFIKSYELVYHYAEKINDDQGLKELRRLKSDMEDKNKSWEQKRDSLRQKLPKISKFQRLIAMLREYESLFIALEALKYFNINFDPHTDNGEKWAQENFRAIFRIVGIVNEALNNISIPLGEGVDEIRGLISSIKYVRNHLDQHPSQFQLYKLEQLKIDTLFPKILQGILNDLKLIGQKIDNRFNNLKKLLGMTSQFDEPSIETILNSANSIDNQADEISYFNSKIIRPGAVPLKTNKFSALLKQAHWVPSHPLKYFQWLRRYLYHPSYPISDPDNEELSTTAKTVIKEECRKNKPNDKPSYSDDCVQSTIEEIERFSTQFGEYQKYLHQLQCNPFHRAKLCALIQELFLALNARIESHDLNFFFRLPRDLRQLFTHNFLELQNRRAFMTHDLWREDSLGLAQLTQIIIHVLKPTLLFTPIPVCSSESSSSMSPVSESSNESGVVKDDESQDSQASNQESSRGTSSSEESGENVIVIKLDENYEYEPYKFENTHLTEAMRKEILEEQYRTELLCRYISEGRLSFEVFEFFIKLGVNLNDYDNHGYTPLILTIDHSSPDMMRQLLINGASPNIFDRKGWGYMPLHYAARSGEHRKVNILLEFGAIPFPRNCSGQTPLEYAQQYSHREVIRALSPLRPVIRGEAASNLFEAVEALAVEKVRECLNRGDNPNHYSGEGRLPLVRAIELLDTISSDNDLQRKQLHEIINLLIQYKANVNLREWNENGETPLTQAALFDDLVVLRTLLNNGALVDLPNLSNETALINAAQCRQSRNISLLLQHRANPNLQDNIGGYTALLRNMNLPQGGDLEILEQLLLYGANPNLRTDFGWTAFHYVIENQRSDLLNLFTKFGANPIMASFHTNWIRIHEETHIQHSIQELSEYLISHIDHPLNPVHIKARPDGEIDYAYEYIDNDMWSVLNYRLQQENLIATGDQQGRPIHVLAPLGGTVLGQQLSEHIRENIKQHQFTKRTLLIPYNIGNRHWVGIVIHINDENHIEAYYLDSLKGKIPENVYREIHDSLNIKIQQSHQVLSQDDNTSCGPLTIENLINAVKQQLAGQQHRSAKEIREDHYTLMRNVGEQSFQLLNPSFARELKIQPQITSLLGYIMGYQSSS